MSNLISGRYIGDRADLKGYRALLRRHADGGWLAQFDALWLPLELTHGWTQFDTDEFNVESETVSETVSEAFEHDPHSRFVGMEEWREHMRGGV